MLTTTLPGFTDLTADSQKTFRVLLTALAEPGKLLEIPIQLTVPEGLTLACGAACLTLIDFETVVWLPPTLPGAVADWLRFHTGCTFSSDPSQATFAIVNDLEAMTFSQFCWGSAEAPEDSTTIFIQLNSQLDTQPEPLQSGKPVVLSGPGILGVRTVSPAVPPTFWQMWQQNHAAYPRGIDCFLLGDRQVMGLPRSTKVQFEEGA